MVHRTTPTRNDLESGAVILLFLALMPLLVLVFGVVIDLHRFYLERERGQEFLDNAALLAARRLPHLDQARAAVDWYADQKFPEYRDNLQIEITSDTVSLSLAPSLPFTLVSYLKGADDSQRTYSMRAAARINSRDVVIFLDNSSYLAPELSDDPHDGWAGDEWPRAQFFANDLPERHFNGQRVSPRLLTQQCFNPAFSPLKEAAIRMYEMFTTFRLNSVGVMAGPDDAEEIVDLKSLTSGSGLQGQGQGAFSYYRTPHTGSYAADEFCLAAAERETAHIGYQLPDPGPYVSTSSDLIGRPEQLVTGPPFRLPPENLRYLSLPEIIWSRAVRRNYVGANQVPSYVNIGAIINRVGNELIGAPSRADRSGGNFDVTATGVILLADLPHQGNARYPDENVQRVMENRFDEINTAAAQAGKHISFYITTVKHQGNYGMYDNCVGNDNDDSLELCGPFMDESNDFEAFLKHLEHRNHWSNLHVFFFRIPDVGSIAQDFLSVFPTVEKGPVLLR